jgi:two-component system chemotaxis response regulator CheY
MKPKVLIADDASFVREILKTIILRQGWIVVGEAQDGAEVIEMATELLPDVIIMDIVMPKFSGIEAAQKILKKLPGLPIIGLSTMDNEEIMSQALGVGLVSYITKPFENWAIVSAIKEALINKEKKSG